MPKFDRDIFKNLFGTFASWHASRLPLKRLKNKIPDHRLLRRVKRMVVVKASIEMTAPVDKVWRVISESVKKTFTEGPAESPRTIATMARKHIEDRGDTRRNCKKNGKSSLILV